MRGKHVLILVIAVLALASIGATAALAGGNENANGGNSETALDNKGQAKKAEATDSSNHDPSNPDGTYQGKSGSTPDQDGIGADHGVDNNDKTGPDTDGNNGCGNDPDREDDNNGWCGKKPANVQPTETPEVSPTATVQAPTEVLGETFTRPSVLGRNLARTGVTVGMFALAALVLGLFGLALRAIASPKHR
jgi:hypothetical protein